MVVDLCGNSNLSCPLSAQLVEFHLRDLAAISTDTTVEGERILWSLKKAIFNINACRHVEGIHVEHMLKVVSVRPSITVAFDVKQGSTCKFFPPGYGVKLNPSFRTRGSLPSTSSTPHLFADRIHEFVRYPNGTFGFADHAIVTFTTPEINLSNEDDEEIQTAISLSTIEREEREEREYETKKRSAKDRKLSFIIKGNVDAIDVPHVATSDKHPCLICLEMVAIVTTGCGHTPYCKKCFDQACEKLTSSTGDMNCIECREKIDVVIIKHQNS
jgi:hypothetical protein